MKPPLEGITILDLSRVLAGPFATMVLAELGATVVKVERPGTGDESREFEPFAGPSVSAYFLACNRSKKSITVNLNHQLGRALIHDLSRKADVFVENFPVGALAEKGLGYDDIRAVNDGIVYLSLSGFGQSGPFSDRKGYDTVFQAMSGIMALTGEKDGPPVKPGIPVADLGGGLWAVAAILTGLLGRARGGPGCHIDLSMLDASIALVAIAAARWFALGEAPPRLGTEHPGRVPSASFRTRDGGFLHITASDAHWAPLCRVLGLLDFAADPELRTNSGRLRRRDEVMKRLEDAVALRDRNDLDQALASAGVPAGPVLGIEEALEGAHAAERGLLASFDHPDIGRFPGIRIPLRLEGWKEPEPAAPPRLGQHTDEVLRGWLSYSGDRIEELRREGVL